MARSSRSAFEGHPLRKRLAAVRRRLRLVVILRGLGWLSALVLLTILGVGLLDWTLHLPSVIRALVLVGTLSAAGVVAYRSLLRPFFSRMDDLTLALRIEERYPSLNDSLASTVEFLEQAEKNLAEGNRGPGTLAVSASMRREAVKRALQKSEGCDFNRVIDSRGLRTAGISGAAAVLAAVVMLLIFTPYALTAIARLADPFGKHDWPRSTQIELEEYRQRMGRNETFEVKANVRGVIPEKAVVLFKADGGSPVEHEVRVAAEGGAKVGRLVAQFRPEKLSRNFSFQVKANDAETDWLRVEVAPPPKLAPLDGKASPQVFLQYPRYTDLTARPLPEGVGSIDAPFGTVVTLRAATNVPIRAAWIRYVPEASHTSPLAAVGVLSSSELANVLPLAAVDAEINGRHRATLSADRMQFSLRFTPVVSGAYILHFEDDTGLPDQRSYELNIRPDPSPTVVLERPSAGKENLDVLPGATLPLKATAEDPTFALRAVWLEYQVNAEPPWRRVPLFDHHQAARDLVVAPLSWAGVVGTSNPLKPTQLVVERPLHIGSFRNDGLPLKEGDQLTVRIAADDFDDVTHGKPPGYSSEVEIRIISRAALDIAINKEQAKLEQDLREVRNQERDAIRKINELENRAAATRKLTPEDLAELARTEQAQQQIRERLDSPEDGSVRNRIDRLLETLKQNDLNHTGVEQRLETLKADLNRISREQLEQIEARLSNVRKLAEVPEDARKEKQAESLDKAAEKAEAQARKLEEQASARPENDPQRARLQEDAKELKDEAGKLREMAAKMREEGKQPIQPQDAKARAEERAKLLEELAKERDRQARQQEKLAGEDATGKEREKLKLAEEMKEEARTLREEARAQEAAARGGDANELKTGLNEARRGQEEVEKTLGEMLQRLESFSGTREIKGEARALLEEQRRLQDEVEAMQKQGLRGVDPGDLTPEQKARLDNVTDQQGRLKERAQQFLDQMKRLAEDRKEKQDLAGAEEMRAALKEAENGNIPGQMKMAQERLKFNQLDNASEEQRGAVKALEDLVKNLDDRRTNELDRQIKDIKEAEKKLEKLFEEQDRLQKKAKEAARIEDPKKREEELKKLAAEQQRIQKETQQAEEQVRRLRSERSADALQQAAKEMEEAVRRLERGENPEEKQDEALDRLDEAAMGLEKQRDENEEELAREQLAKIADTLKRLKERQDRMVEEGGRIRKEVLEQKEWTRGLIISLGDLSRAQEGLADESASIAERDLPGAPVFARMLRKAVDSMKKASESMTKHREKVRQDPKGTESDTVAERAQADAKRRLDQLVDALKMDKGAQARRPNNEPGGGGDMGGDMGGGGGAPGDGIPTIAQLKLLRAMQADINERTRDFHKAHPDAAKLTEDEKKELQALSKEEREIAELLEEYTRPEAGEGDRP